MGSNFFKTMTNPRSLLDPAGALIGSLAGPNSFIAKEAHYDPLASSGFGKAVAPAMYNAGQAYGARHNVDAGPTPFQGINPTLQDANNQYGTAPANAYVQQAQRVAQQQQPRPQQGQQTWGTYGY